MLEIHFKDDFEFTSEPKNVYSTFYYSFDGFDFPDNRWSDNSLEILKVWCGNIFSKQSKFKILFLEGPYHIECTRKADGLHFQMICTRIGRQIKGEGVTSIDEFEKHLFEISKSLIKAVEEKAVGEIQDLNDLRKIVSDPINLR